MEQENYAYRLTQKTRNDKEKSKSHCRVDRNVASMISAFCAFLTYMIIIIILVFIRQSSVWNKLASANST